MAVSTSGYEGPVANISGQQQAPQYTSVNSASMQPQVAPMQQMQPMTVVNLQVAGGNNVNNNNMVNNGGYQTEETVTLDTKERTYNGIRAQFGMRTRSINLGLDTTIDNNGYFVERKDTLNYDSNMTPWVGYENNYLLGLHTTKFINLKGTCCKGKGNAAGIEFGSTVLHYKGSQRLIIKKRDQLGVLQQSRKQILLWFAILLLIISFILMGTGDGGSVAVGVFMMLISCYLFYIIYKSGKSGEGNAYSFTTQSIPLNSIFWVDRKLTLYDENDCCTNCCQCCCPEQTDIDAKFSIISIGFNRNVRSDAFIETTFTSKVAELDLITLKLENNQAYNLQQYLDCIMSGKNVMQYNHIDSKFIYYKDLPN